MNDRPPSHRTSLDSGEPEPAAAGDEDQRVVLLPPVDLNEPFGPTEEPTKVVVVEADPVFSPHPALLAQQERAGTASAGASPATPAVWMPGLRPVLPAIVSAAICLSLLGLVFSLLLHPSSSHHAPAGRSVRSSAAASSTVPSIPGLPPASSPAASPTAPASRSMSPPSGGSCRLGAVTVTQGSGSLTADLTIMNTGASVIKSWTFVFFFSGKLAWVTSVSHGVFAQMGHQVTVSSPPSDLETIVPGSSVHTSFQAMWRGNNPMPISFRLTSLTCSSHSP